jgi:hypothetical protein
MDTEEPKLVVVSSLEAHKVKQIDWDSIIQAYQAGIKPEVLAVQHGIGVATIYRRLRKLGLSGPSRQAIKDKADQKMYERNLRTTNRSKRIRKRQMDALEAAFIDEEDDEGQYEEDVLDSEANRVANMQVKHRRILNNSRRAVEIMLLRFMKAECTKIVETKTGLQVVVSASDEIKNLTNCLKVLLPLERQAHGLDEDTSGGDEARKAAEAARKAEAGVQEVLEEMRRVRTMAETGTRG